MNISQYIKLERGNAASLAQKLNISPSYLSQLAVVNASISPARCVEIEQATNGQVTRKDLRSDDWQAIWPELATPQPAPSQGYNGPERRSADLEAEGVDGLKLVDRRKSSDKA